MNAREYHAVQAHTDNYVACFVVFECLLDALGSFYSGEQEILGIITVVRCFVLWMERMGEKYDFVSFILQFFHYFCDESIGEKSFSERYTDSFFNILLLRVTDIVIPHRIRQSICTVSELSQHFLAFAISHGYCCVLE